VLAFARHSHICLVNPELANEEGPDKSVSAWEKAKILSVIVASVFIPLAVALSGNWYAKSLKEKETQARYIELAIGILMKEPTPENEQIRKWAIDTINHYSEVPIQEPARQELLEQQLRTSNETAKRIIEEMGR
jgi:hypothetical protein